MVLGLFLVHSLHSSGPRVRVAEAFRVGTVSKKLAYGRRTVRLSKQAMRSVISETLLYSA